MQLQLISSGVAAINTEQRSIQGLSPGQTELSLKIGSSGVPFDTLANITVTENVVNIRKLDPIIASLRLSLSSDRADNRLETTEVSLQVRPSLFFTQERAEVTASVILNDGRRVVIDDSNLLKIQSSNDSIVRVEDNFIIAEEMGTINLMVSFVVCGRQLASSIVEVTVDIDQNRPTFADDSQDAEIVENSPMGTLVTTVRAVDLDFAANEETDTEYRFRDEASSSDRLWTINPITGEIYLNGPIDRETRDSYELIVEATDRSQRQAEQDRRNRGVGCNGGSGMGSGSGQCDNGLLMPDISLPEADPPDTIIVS